MFFFYWLVSVMPLDQHEFWGQELVGTFTLIKALGVLCLVIALIRIGSQTAWPRLLHSPQARWYSALVLLQCSSYLVLGGQLVYASGAYSHVFSILGLLVATLTLVDREPRLYRTLLATIAGVGFASLHAIRQQHKYGAIYEGFRPGGMSGDANVYALVVGLWVPLAFIWAFSKRPHWERAFCFACLLSTLLGTTFAASRGGFLGLTVAFLFLVWRSGFRVRNFVVVSTLVVPLALFYPASPWRRFQQPGYGDRLAQEARLTAWKAGLRMIRAHPLTGVGIANFKPLVAQYEDPGEQVISIAHNTYLEIAAEVGVPALIVFLGILFTAFRALEQARRRAQAARVTHLSNVALGLQAGLVSYLVSAFFVSSWWEKMLWLLVFLTICLHRLAREVAVSTQGHAAGLETPPRLPLRSVAGPTTIEALRRNAVRCS